MSETISKSKLTLWVDTEIKRFGKEWAKQHHGSLSQVVSDYLVRLRWAGKPAPAGPWVQKLSGLLKSRRRPDTASYGKYLEKKYLGP